MSELAVTETLESAVTSWADEDSTAGAVAPVERDTTPAAIEGSESVPIHTVGGISLEDAAKLDIADDPAPRPKGDDAEEQPIVVVGDRPVTLTELVRGYTANQEHQDARSMIQAQYHQLVAAAQSITASAWDLAGYMVDRLPAEPSVELSFTQPAAYTQQKVIHDAAVEEISYVLDRAKGAKEAAATLSQQQHGQTLVTENALLIKHFPETANQKGRERFFERIRDVAYACDFTESELKMATDHRLFRLADLAARALEAADEKARKAVFRPDKKKPQQKPKRSNNPALDRLTESGTIADAMKVDFD